MAYCTIQDMIDRFGIKEMTCLADRSEPPTGLILDDGKNELRVQNAILDACAELDLMLGCCFRLKELKDLITSGSTFQILKHWNSDIARYHLYDRIQLGKDDEGNDHESYRRYKQAIKAIEKFCSCPTPLCDQNGECIYPMHATISSIAVEKKESCFPKANCCCNKTPCSCGC